MRRFPLLPALYALAFVSAAAMVVTLAFQRAVPVSAAPASSDAAAARYAERAIDEFVNLVNGMWVLNDRYNPDGSRHAEPLRGWTRIDISPAKTTMLSTRAMGSITAEETGVWDKRMGPSGPADTFGKPFYIESNGTWEIMLDPAEPLNVGSGEAHILVAQMSTVRGTYTPYSGGLMTQLDSRYRLTFSRTENGVAKPASMTLVQPIKPNEPITFRGRVLPNAWMNPIDFKGQPIAKADLESSDCAVEQFSVTGKEMHIKWVSGARDYWTNRPDADLTDSPSTPARSKAQR